MADLLFSGGVDWRSQERLDSLHADMVSPSALSQTYGRLGGIVPSSCSVDTAYYSDTRESAKVAYRGDGWRRGTLLRLWHDHGGRSDAIGTYVATDDPSKLSGGAWTTTLTLHSALHMLSTDLLRSPLTVEQGVSAVEAMRHVCEAAGRPVRATCHDSRVGSTVVFEAGKSRLSALFGLATPAGVRVDVDAMGYVTLEDYVSPASRSPGFELSLADPRGIVHDGVLRSSSWLSLPGEAVVVCKYTEKVPGADGREESVEREIDGLASVTAGAASRAARGYGIGVTSTESQFEEPHTQEHADQLARDLLARNSWAGTEWKVTTQYFPVREGDVGSLVVPDAPLGYQGSRRVLVKSTSLDLATWQLDLTLRETDGMVFDSE